MPEPTALPGLSAEEMALRRQRLPSRWMPILYFGLAHLALIAAFLVIGLDPAGVAGFYYHPRMLAVVHLVTLGWISCSILGALYMIAPMALRAPLPPRRLDAWAFAAVAIGIVGLVGHFWLGAPRGMEWAAGTAATGFLLVGARVWRALRGAPVAAGVKLHLRLAFVNLLVAASLGLLIALHRVHPFLPVEPLAPVLAHAHLAVLGWALMTVMGAAYRLLPMLLPAAMPRGRSLLASALLLETGTLGLATALFLGARWRAPFAWLVAAGIVAFLAHVLWMRLHPRPAPKALRRPDLGIAHVTQALLYLALATALGLRLASGGPAVWKLDAAMLYGVCGLLGFLAQMVIGVASRLFPLFAWLWSFAESSFRTPPPSPHGMLSRGLQWGIFTLWTAGVPLLAAGLFRTEPGTIRLASGLLGGAAVLLAVANGRVLRRALPASGGKGREAGAAG